MQGDWEWLSLVDEQRATKDLRARVEAFVTWATGHKHTLATLNLATYRDFLLKDRQLAANTVRSHLATIRGRIRTMLENGSLREHLLRQGQSADQTEALLGQVVQAIQPGMAQVKVPKKTRRNKGLTAEEVNALLEGPDVETLLGLRDAAAIALMVTTGIREHELCGLDVEDLEHQWDGHRALRIREGVGSTARFVPYGEYGWVVPIVKTWLQVAGITEGAIFRGFYKSGRLMRQNRLSPRAVERLIANYPIIIDGEAEEVVLKPLDLRHAYAYNQYQRGVDMDTLSAELGLKSSSTILDYVDWGRDRRGSGEAFHFDRRRLEHWSGYEHPKGGGR